MASQEYEALKHKVTAKIGHEHLAEHPILPEFWELLRFLDVKTQGKAVTHMLKLLILTEEQLPDAARKVTTDTDENSLSEEARDLLIQLREELSGSGSRSQRVRLLWQRLTK